MHIADHHLVGVAWRAAAVAATFVPLAAGAQAPLQARELPARSIPVPTTVSPQMQSAIAAPLSPIWNAIPRTAEEWKAQIEAGAATAMKGLPALRERMRVKVEPSTIDGVKVHIVSAVTIPPQNANRLLIHIHGGCYAGFPGESGSGEAIQVAGFGGFRVVSIDYRMPPDHPYPAALDDIMTVWKAMVKTTDPKRMAVFGTSAGGALTLSMALRAKQEKLPLPAALYSGTPMADLTNAGDTFQTNAMLDNVLVAPDGNCDRRAALYANGRDLKDPMLSPVYGDFSGFPPTILLSGTRDLLLSSTVRVHRKLRQAGVAAVLQVFEGQAHAHYLRDAPEAREAFEEVTAFFDSHLAR
jgi:monoterpene epsilon-lactone hydrolase